MKRLKVLGICTSPRKGKNTQQLLEAALEGSKSVDVEVEMYTIANKVLNPCRGCSVCQTGKNCPIQDDITDILNKMKEADVVLIGTPTFFYSVTAQCKMIIDRSYAVQPLNQNKVGGILVTAGSMGAASALSTIDMFFDAQGITSAGHVIALGESNNNEKALLSAFDLGVKAVNMAKILKGSLHYFGMHNHYAYGTHTK